MLVRCYEVSGILCGVSIEPCKCFVLPMVQIPANLLHFLTESTELNFKEKKVKLVRRITRRQKDGAL